MTETNNQLSGATLDISAQRKQELKQLFPSVFTETMNDQGQLVDTIDFERLKAELGQFSELYDNRRERYTMDWPGKKDCLRLIQEPSYGTLKPSREESVDFDTTENLFIEGDNLEVLKLLQKSYYGQVKMIYIDPPYNTGKEFIYPDNFSESLDTYLEYAGLKEAGGDGRKFSSNSQNEGRFHTKWLNMMYPRLYLARNLLREDGVIFISIDDNEVENLRRICNEIFGEENFVTSLIWQKVYAPKNSAKYFSEDHDFILVYCRNREVWSPTLLPRTSAQDSLYKNLDSDPRGAWMSDNLTARNYYSGGMYEVVGPTGKSFSPPRGTYWRISETKFNDLNEDGRIWWGADKNNTPRLKRFLSEVSSGRIPQTILFHKEVGHTQEAKKELLEYVDFENTENVLNSVKPTRLLQHLIKVGTRPDQGDIVMDFFSGSAPLGHATLHQNRDDSGNRRFILVQLPEPLNTEEAKAKYISDLGKLRLRNVAQKKSLTESSKLDLSDHSLDEGFKVLKLDQSNFKQWQAPSREISDEEALRQLELHINPIDQAATDDDLLTEIMIKSGLPLTTKVEALTIAGHTLYSMYERDFLVYLGKDIDQALIDAVLTEEPSDFICLDSAFHGNEALRSNAAKSFATYNQDTDGVRITFRTV